MRPKPSTPSVFSYSSTPLNSARSHAPPVSEPCACGTFRASASSSASVCSAAVITFDWGAFATITPRFVAASTSTLSTPTPGPPDRLQALGALEQRRVELGGGADQDAVELADAALELRLVPVDADLDLEPGVAQQLHAGVADLLLDEDLHAWSATPASEKTRCAAATPAPGSTSWPSSRSVISSAETVTMMSKAPK